MPFDAAPALPLGAVVLGSRAGWCVATWRNVMILHVSGELDGAFLDTALAGHHAALAVEPRGYGVLSVAEPTARLPGTDLRQRAIALRRQTQQRLRAQAMVIGGEGFFASAMRGVLTGIFTLAESRVPLVMVAADAQAADFVVRRACSADAEPGDLVAVLASMRRAAQHQSRSASLPR